MSYDFDGVTDRRPPQLPPMPPANPRDLEVIVSLLTLAAIELTPAPGTTFTFEQLLAAAQDYEIMLERRDVEIVVPFLKFLRKEPGRRFSLK